MNLTKKKNPLIINAGKYEMGKEFPVPFVMTSNCLFRWTNSLKSKDIQLTMWQKKKNDVDLRI